MGLGAVKAKSALHPLARRFFRQVFRQVKTFLIFWTLIFAVCQFLSLTAFAECENPLKQYYAQWPRTSQVGTSHVHRHQLPKEASKEASKPSKAAASKDPKAVENKFLVFTIYQPVAGDYQGPLYDLTNYPDSRDLPEVILLGDGALDIPLTLIDYREGSPLRKQIRDFVKALQIRTSSQEELLQILATELRELLAGPNNWLGPRLKEFLPDLGFQDHGEVTDQHKKAFAALAEKPELFVYWRADTSTPVVPLEYMLADPKRMMCFHHSLFVSLILRELNIEHQLVTGFSASETNAKKFIGHTWIQLPDGRSLDAQWKLLEKPEAAKDGFSKISRSYSQRNAHFPFMKVEKIQNDLALPRNNEF